MKKIIFILVFFELIGANALEHFEQHGDFSGMAVVKQKPSSQKDMLFFKLPESRWDVGYWLDDQVSGQFEVIFAKTRIPVGERWTLQMERSYLDYKDILSGGYFAQFGLLPQEWSQWEEKFWPYRSTTEYSEPLMSRYGYLNRSDAGLKFGQTMSNETRWIVAYTNGEGSAADETGPKKDLQIFFESVWGQIHFAASWLAGAYDNVDASVANKERTLVGIYYEQELGFLGGLSFFSAKDAVDAINQKIADQVDLTAQGGQNLSSQGASLVARYRTSPKFEIFSRYDVLNPAVGVDAKGLRQTLLGFGFFPRQHLQFSLAWGDVQYEQNHASAVRDASQVAFVSRLKW